MDVGGANVQFGQLSLAALYLLLAAAAARDAASRRVPNGLSVAVAMLGLAVQLGAGGARAALLAGGAALLVLAVLLVPFSRRMVGGGDVKLLVACAAWTGFQRLAIFVLATALAGGLIALAAAVGGLRAPAMATGRAAMPTLDAATLRARLRAVRVPYAIAIAAGAVIALHWRLP